MKRSLLAILPLVAIITADAAVGQEEQATWVAGEPECVPGEFIVKYRTDTSAEQRLTVAASVGDYPRSGIDRRTARTRRRESSGGGRQPSAFIRRGMV